MANQRITDLAEDTAPADDDLLTAVDVSDTSMSALGTNKKLQAQNLVVKKLRTSTGPTVLEIGAIADGEVLKRSGGTIIGAASGAPAGTAFELVVACSDLTTALTTGTGKITFPWPRAVTLSSVHAFLVTPQASGSIFTVDVNEGGTTILSTKITIDNGEADSTTAATQPVLSDASLAAMASITVDIDQVGNGTAKGLYLVFIGVRA